MNRFVVQAASAGDQQIIQAMNGVVVQTAVPGKETDQPNWVANPPFQLDDDEDEGDKAEEADKADEADEEMTKMKVMKIMKVKR